MGYYAVGYSAAGALFQAGDSVTRWTGEAVTLDGAFATLTAMGDGQAQAGHTVLLGYSTPAGAGGPAHHPTDRSYAYAFSVEGLPARRQAVLRHADASQSLLRPVYNSAGGQDLSILQEWHVANVTIEMGVSSAFGDAIGVDIYDYGTPAEGFTIENVAISGAYFGISIYQPSAPDTVAVRNVLLRDCAANGVQSIYTAQVFHFVRAENCLGYGLRVRTGSEVRNCVALWCGTDMALQGGTDTSRMSHNVTSDPTAPGGSAATGFAAADLDDWQSRVSYPIGGGNILDTSGLAGAGVAVAGVTADWNGAPRPDPPAVGPAEPTAEPFGLAWPAAAGVLTSETWTDFDGARSGLLTTGSPPPLPAASVTDNGDGSGATLTLTGSDPAAENRVYTAAFGAAAWALAATLTGDGSVPLGLATGPHWVHVESRIPGGAALTRPLAVGVTDAAAQHENEIRSHLRNLLVGDPELTALLATGEAVYWEAPPRSAGLPCIAYREEEEPRPPGQAGRRLVATFTLHANRQERLTRLAGRLEGLLPAAGFSTAGWEVRRLEALGRSVRTGPPYGTSGEPHRELALAWRLHVYPAGATVSLAHGETAVTLPAPAPAVPARSVRHQAAARTAAGTPVVSDGGLRTADRVLHFQDLTAAEVEALLAFFHDTVLGRQETFTYTDAGGEPHPVRFAAATLAPAWTGPATADLELPLEEA